MAKDTLPPKPKKRIEKPWVIAAFGAPMRLISKGTSIPGAVSVLVILLFMGVMIYYILPRPKSFFLDVTTDYLEVVTDTDTQIVWDINEAVLCLPARRLPEDHAARRAPDSVQSCGEQFIAQSIRDVQLDWPNEVRLILRSGLEGGLDILIRFDPARDIEIGSVPIVTETLLRLPPSVLEWNGGLGLSGALVVGQTAEQGTLKLLREGLYETRERPFFRDEAQLVDSGTFSMGDVVSIEPRQAGLVSSSYAFVTLSGNKSAGVVPMRVIATSPRGTNRLRLDRARANSSYLEPTWSQRIANDPMAIGIATLLSLLATFLGVLNNLFRR